MNTSSSRITITTILLLCLTPLVAAIAPRGLAFIAPITGLIAFMGYTLRDYKMPLPSRNSICALCTALALMSASILWGYDADAITLKYPIKTAPLFLGIALLAGVIAHYRDEIAPRLCTALMSTCLIGAVLVTINLYGDSAIYRAIHPEDIYLKNLSHLNRSVVATILLCALSLFMFTAQRAQGASNKAQHILAWAIGFALIPIIIKTDSQSAQLAAIAGVLCAVIIPYSYNKFWIIPAVTITALLLSAPFIAQHLFAYIASSVEGMAWLKDGYAAARMEIWDFVSRRALDRPWLGHGIEATRSIKDFDIAHVYHIENGVLHPHNFAIQTWIEFGLLGAAVFSALIGVTLRGIWRNASIHSRRAQFTLFAMVLIMAAISYGMWQGWWIGLIGFIFAGAQVFYPERDARSDVIKSDKSSGSAASY